MARAFSEPHSQPWIVGTLECTLKRRCRGPKGSGVETTGGQQLEHVCDPTESLHRLREPGHVSLQPHDWPQNRAGPVPRGWGARRLGAFYIHEPHVSNMSLLARACPAPTLLHGTHTDPHTPFPQPFNVRVEYCSFNVLGSQPVPRYNLNEGCFLARTATLMFLSIPFLKNI